jgi:hypothetical protein
MVYRRSRLKRPINEKEAYAMVRGMKVNQGILRAKPFLVATDHWNLTFVERDPNSKMQRYLLEMQLMPIKGCLRINGKDNPADYPSRWHKIEDTTTAQVGLIEDNGPSFSEREFEKLASFNRARALDGADQSLHYLSQAESVYEKEHQFLLAASADAEADADPNVRPRSVHSGRLQKSGRSSTGRGEHRL